ncbi:DNA primase [Thiomicrospira sp. WB1]|uniref:DNA primase n=1 Tax=Thiomicrospira sp. WB1 TaxID=1685380 RepID=UPI000747689A|nr:DNA primase [Thiomicrospira sp. WB1]KUJ72834.1 DNA primase [Thiomicrospira sp. WB1]
MVGSNQTQQSGSIPRAFIDDLLNRTDLVQLINARVPLKKAGTNYKACCPFHDEKTPSFNVNGVKQFYHCFGCGASGDAIRFLQDYDGLTFVEAVEALASFNGMEVPREKISPAMQAQQQKTRDLYDLMFQVAKFYRQQLKLHARSEEAKQYLRQRGLTPEIAKTFAIGYAPPGWETLLTDFAPTWGESTELPSQLVDTGMLIEKEGGRRYDRFRHRIMFPIRDGRGRVVAFGGRVVSDDDQPKYLNSPETTLFHKTQTLYGVYEMRQSRQRFDRVLVVEGYMDVVALAQFGIRNAVATLGTAVTAEHLQTLFRELNEVVFCFDGDQAGQKAAWKALELALPQMQATRSVKFLFLPEGADPDSCVREEGVEGFTRRVDQALTLSAFLFKGLEARLTLPLSTPEGQQQLIALAKPYITQAPEALPDVLTQQLSDKVQVPVWRLGQIMGIRVAGRNRPKNEGVSEPLPKLKVHSKVLRLLKILSAYPMLTKGVPPELFERLQQSDQPEHRFLVEAMQTLLAHNCLSQALADWLQDTRRQRAVALLDQLELPATKEGVVDDFQFLTQQLHQELTQPGLAKRADDWSLEDIAAWQAQQKAQKL